MIAQITWMHFGLMLWICAAIFLLRWVANGAVLFSLLFWIHGCLVLLFGSFILFLDQFIMEKQAKLLIVSKGKYITISGACTTELPYLHVQSNLNLNMLLCSYKPLPQPVITYQALIFHEAACVYNFAVLTLSEIVWELLVTSHVCFFFVLLVF